ncbi:MAG: helix-turn-helix transcriptional regulator [Pyrinomonadaceae bacterium]
MATTKFDERFFESTRGKIVLLLRTSKRTVNELAEALDLSDNAVRAHLLTLERDGLVTQGGTIKGFRKPHYVFKLTDEARHIFPKFYDSLLNRLLGVLKQKMPSASLTSILHDVGINIGRVRPKDVNSTFEERVNGALSSLEELGGAVAVVTESGRTLIKSEGCPFADAVTEHPEVCRVAESMIEEIVGQPVKEICDRTASPKCCFVIDAK